MNGSRIVYYVLVGMTGHVAAIVSCLYTTGEEFYLYCIASRLFLHSITE
jgi:hypothetical protein